MQLYSFLYRLTNDGKNIIVGQWIFLGCYLTTLAAVMACYLKAQVGCQLQGLTEGSSVYSSSAGALQEIAQHLSLEVIQ